MYHIPDQQELIVKAIFVKVINIFSTGLQLPQRLYSTAFASHEGYQGSNPISVQTQLVKTGSDQLPYTF